MARFFPPVIVLILVHLQLMGQDNEKPGSKNLPVSGINTEKQISEPGSDKIKDLYFKSLTFPDEVINGKEYLLYFYHSKTTPLLFANSIFKAVLVIDGRTYKNINMQYDTFLDYAVCIDTSKILNSEFPRIALNKELVEGFSFMYKGENYNFRLLKFAADSRNSPGDGFYEIVYNGPSMYIIKHRSTEYIKDAVSEYKYSPLKYIYIDGSFRRFSNMKEFIALFGQKEQDIKSFIRTNRIRIKRAGKNEISGILKYYDSSVQK